MSISRAGAVSEASPIRPGGGRTGSDRAEDPPGRRHTPPAPVGPDLTLEQAAVALAAASAATGAELEFEVDAAGAGVVVKLCEQGLWRVVRRIPAADALRMARQLQGWRKAGASAEHREGQR